MSGEMIKTITGAGFNVDEFLKVCKAIGGLGLASQPDLIQGYTAENWQEIIDGGYLCEYSQNGIHWSKATWPLENIINDLFEGDGGRRSFCRPAQIKGVMRPIFVEPVDVDKITPCTFFSASGLPVSPDGVNDIYGAGFRYGMWVDEAKKHGATKYIEL